MTTAWCRLKWDHHLSHTKDTLSEAWLSRRHTDMTIVAENKVIRCHKIVLSNNIEYFRNLLSQDYIDDKPLVVAIMAPYELINALLTFTYLGEVNILKSNLTQLIKLAEELGVIGLINTNNNTNCQPEITQSPSVLFAAEALQNLGKAASRSDLLSFNKYQRSFPADYHVAPRQPSSEVSNQPSTGEQPPTAQQDQVDFQSLRYKAAASRKSPPVSAPISPPAAIKKRRLSRSTSLGDSPMSPEPRNVSPSTSGSSYAMTKEEEPDSEDSDRELHIDEGEDPSPMQYCDEQMYVLETEPQDLRVESRQNALDKTLSSNDSLNTSGMLQSTSSGSPMFLPSTSSIGFCSIASDVLQASATPHFLTSTMNDVSIETVNKKRPNGFGISLLTAASSCNNLVSMVNANSVRKKSPPHSKDSSNSKSSHGGSKSSEKSYSFDQLTAAVEVVVKGEAQPVEAINHYSIPRRTFFRHLKNRRTELGIETKTRSKPSSRATSPSHAQSTGNSNGSTSATPTQSHLVTSLHNHIPTSGTHLHAMLKSITSAKTKVSCSPSLTAQLQTIIKQEQEDGSVDGHNSFSSIEDQAVSPPPKESIEVTASESYLDEAHRDI